MANKRGKERGDVASLRVFTLAELRGIHLVSYQGPVVTYLAFLIFLRRHAEGRAVPIVLGGNHGCSGDL